MLDIKVDGYKRISKRTARRLYYDGFRIYIIPVNVRFAFDHMLIRPAVLEFWDLNNKCGLTGDGCSPQMSKCDRDFDKLINEYTYYNCDAELGRYVAYYMRKV